MNAGPGWARVRDALGDLLELAGDERAAALAGLRDRDPELAVEVADLLARSGDETGPLAASAIEQLAGDRAPGDVPARVGPWRLTGKLGEGGMGTVWRGRRDDGAFAQEVAVKFVRPDLARGLGDRRLEAERRILATLDHPGIARLVDGGTTPEGAAYLVLELVEGEPIDVWCDRRATPLEERLRIFLAVTEAVDSAHRKLVLHRDLKSANVLVDTAGRPKLLDFGIAKLLDPLAGEPELTVSGEARPLTPSWASPEQLRGEALSLAADVWALGLLLCQLVAGARPATPEGDSPAEIARAIERRGPPDLAALGSVNPGGAAPGVDRRRLAGDLARIAARAAHPDPDLRYRSAAELGADVAAFLDSRPVSAHPPSAVYRARRFVRRHRVATAATAVAGLALVALSVVSVRQAARARAEKERAERRLADLRALAGDFLFDFEFRLQSLAGATELRRDLAATSLRYLDLVSREAGDDPALLADLARGYFRLGQTQGSPFVASLGDGASANASAEKAVDLAARLSALAPGSASAARAVAEAHMLRADLRFGAGEIAGADADAVVALEAARDALAVAPSDRDLRRLATACYSRRGVILAAAARFDDAVAVHREAVALSERFAAEDPATYLRNARVARMLLGEALNAAGRPEEALAELRPMLEALDRERRERADDATLQRDFSAAVDRVVATLIAAGRGAEALPVAERGLEVTERLVAADPANDLGQYDLVASLTQVGSAALAAGDLPRARSVYARGLALAVGITKRDPKNVLARFARVDCAVGLADADVRGGSRTEGIATYRRLVEEVRGLGREFPEAEQARQYERELAARLAAAERGSESASRD